MAKIVLTTTDRGELAKEIAAKAVREKKAACVNILRNVVSVYTWEGSVEEQEEFLLVCKTDDSREKDLQSLIGEMHNYDLPEIISLDVTGGSQEYLKWIKESCRS